jgi:carboxyl-terminal processing protease
MRSPVRSTARRVAGALAGVTVIGAAFTAGVVAGAASQPVEQPAGGVLEEAAVQIEAQALQPVDREVLDAAAIAGMLRVTGDEWGTWGVVEDLSGPAAPRDHVGVGLWLRSVPSGAVVVADVAAGSPAALAGVRAGDEVRAVDHRSAAGLAAPVVAATLRGLPGSTVTLVLRRDTALRTVVLARAAVPAGAAGVRVERLALAGRVVTHIAVPSLHRGSGREVREAVQDAADSEVAGVLLDLRGCPGGLLDEAVETASAFLDAGPVVRYTRRDGHNARLDAVGAGDVSLPLVVLVDGGTASAAEVVAAALQERGRAVVVGSRTFGKGSVQEPHRLSDGSALQLTVARWSTPQGRSLEGGGLLPDLEVAAGSDPEAAVRRGVDVLTGLLASAGGAG